MLNFFLDGFRNCNDNLNLIFKTFTGMQAFDGLPETSLHPVSGTAETSL